MQRFPRVTSWSSGEVTFTIEPHEDIVRLTVRHDGLPTESDYQAISGG